MFFTSRDFFGFNWHSFAKLPARTSLLWLSMTWRQKYLAQNYYFSIKLVTWSLALLLLFCSVRRSLYSGKAFLAKPNVDANYFYFILGELTKISQCMTSFSKIAEKKLNKHCHVLHSIHSHNRWSKLLIINHSIAETTSKISFEIISVLIRFFGLVLYHSLSNINLQNSFIYL